MPPDLDSKTVERDGTRRNSTHNMGEKKAQERITNTNYRALQLASMTV